MEIAQIKNLDKEGLKKASKKACNGEYGKDTKKAKKAIWKRVKELKP